MKYQVWVTSGEYKILRKTCPTKKQAYIWCWLNGYIYRAGRYGYWLHPDVEIKEIRNEY
jgi:hypothetical protein